MRLVFVLACVLSAAACGGNNPGGGDDAAPDSSGGPDGSNLDCSNPPDLTGRMYPWKVGTTWTWILEDPANPGVTQTNDTTVMAYEPAPGHPTKCAFKITGEKLFGNTISWDDYEGDIGVRYYQSDYDMNGALVDDQSEDPYRYKIDETPGHLTQGATYSETFNETTTDANGTMTRQKQENWEVINAAESVTVPAGTYTAVHLQRVNAQDPTKIKDFWFVAGVGKVKEIGGSQNQELMAYSP